MQGVSYICFTLACSSDNWPGLVLVAFDKIPNIPCQQTIPFFDKKEIIQELMT